MAHYQFFTHLLEFYAEVSFSVSSPIAPDQASRCMPCVLWIYDFDLFRMRPTHLLVNFTPPCTDWLAASPHRKWPPSHVSYTCRPLRWKARRVLVPGGMPGRFRHSHPPITATQQQRKPKLPVVFSSCITFETFVALVLCFRCTTWQFGMTVVKCFMHHNGLHGHFLFLFVSGEQTCHGNLVSILILFPS